MKEKLVLYWSRRDFRLRDNPALSAAIAYSKKEDVPFLPIFVVEDYMCAGDPKFQFGYPSRYFPSKALPQFFSNFETSAVVKGKGAHTIMQFHKAFELSVFVNEDVYLDFYKQIAKLRDSGVSLHIHKDQMTVDRSTVTGAEKQYSVFTPFKNKVWQAFIESTEASKLDIPNVTYLKSEAIPKSLVQLSNTFEVLMKTFGSDRTCSIGTDTFEIDSHIHFLPDLEGWYSSEKEVHAAFKQFLKQGMSTYKDDRNFLSIAGTSRMSLALAWGLTSARILKNEIQKHFESDFSNPFSSHTNAGALHFISELIWREFYKYLFFHDSKLIDTEFQEKYRGTIAWAEHDEAKKRFSAWVEGKTGYAVVDAAMIELAKTGWMHNRARMVVASVLTKNLGVDWRWGQEYFRAMLIDLDEASNNGGWQWGASVGADPKPIRIFNPYLQAENYDAEGAYQKKWLGEERYVHELTPIIPHADARSAALKRYGLAKK
jgi:deoxyribodipyrimidine photo-lyase